VIGQSVSLIGSWTETVAQALLVLQLTHSGVWLGLATSARYLPVLLLTPYAGLIVDRADKRRVLLITQASLGVVSLTLGVVVVLGAVHLWTVFAVALAFGVLTALDNPARMAFIPEIVGPGLIRNAVTLNSTFVNVGRAVGPVVAASLVASVGVAHRAHQLRDGFAYARTIPEILAPLCMMALIGTFTYEFEVSLPLFAHGPLAGGATTYSWLMAAFGLGSVAGGIYNTRHAKTGVPRMIRAAVLYTLAMLATACSNSLPVAATMLTIVGFASITFLTTGNSTIQLAAAPPYRGRVTALWSTAFVGSTPVGATIIGAIGALSPRLALVVGGAACAAAAITGLAVFAHPHIHARLVSVAGRV
jgi:MFS family permease